MDFALILEIFPGCAREQVEREAQKRGCSAPELLASLADRYVQNRRYKLKIDRLVNRFLVTKLLPRDPITAIMVDLVIRQPGRKKVRLPDDVEGGARRLETDSRAELIILSHQKPLIRAGRSTQHAYRRDIPCSD